MVAVFLDEQRVTAALGAGGGEVSVAAVNGPETTVISGRRVAVQAVLDALALDPHDFRRLDVSVAAHSPLVEPILDEFERAVAGVTLSPPRITLVSSMTGEPAGDEITTAGYWRRHLRQPVRFAAVFDTVRAAGGSTFVEIGPHPTLTSLGQRCWPDGSATWAPSLHRDRGGWDQLLCSLAVLFAAGVPVDWAGFDRPYPRRRLALPTYPWQPAVHWSAAARPVSGPRPVEMWTAASAAAVQQSDQGPLDLRVDGHAARSAALDHLATMAILRAVRDLGLFTTAGEHYRPDQLVAMGVVRPTHGPLVARWLQHLADDGYLERQPDGTFAGGSALPPADLDAAVAAATVAFAGPDPLLAYVAAFGERLAAIVTGAESAVALLFPDGSSDIVDFLYSRSATARYLNGIGAAAVAAVATARQHQPLRVLEIGAGTGGTSAALMAALPADLTSYTFTDVSEFFLGRAADRFAAVPFVRFGLLDIEQPPADQGYPAQSYDIVVATDVLHATRHLDTALEHARSLLAPGGVLLAYETTAHPRWLDVTTGLIEDWAGVEAARRHGPLLSADGWTAALSGAGFSEVLPLPRPDQATAVFGQHVILARAPGEETAAVAVLDLAEPGIDQPVRAAHDPPVAR